MSTLTALTLVLLTQAPAPLPAPTPASSPDFIDARRDGPGWLALAAGGWLYQWTSGAPMELHGTTDGPAVAFATCGDHRAVLVGPSGALVVVSAGGVRRRLATKLTEDLWAVAAASCGEVVAVGDKGRIIEGSVEERAEPLGPARSPTSLALYGVDVRRGGEAVAVGAGGTVLRRERPGEWAPLVSGTDAALLSVRFVDGGGGDFVVAGTGGLWRGDARGLSQTWSDPAEAFTRVELLDQRVGVALGQAYVLLTWDGGRTWARRDEPGWLSAIPYGASAFLLLGRDGAVKVLDAREPRPTAAPEKPRPITRLPDRSPARTPAASKPGESSEPTPAEVSVKPRPLAPVKPDCRGPLPPGGFSGPGFVDIRRADAGLVLAGADGTVRLLQGERMSVVAKTGVPMLGTAVSADRRRVAVVGSGKLAYSTDGGRTFRVETSPGEATFFAAAFAGNSLFIFDDEGNGYRSADGSTFAPLKLPRPVTFWTASFSGEQRGYVVGRCGTLLATEDGGATWRALSAPSEDPQGVLAVGDSLYVASFEGVFRSRDGGRSFTRVLEVKNCIRLSAREGMVAVSCGDIGQPLWVAAPGGPFRKVELDRVVHLLLAAEFDENGELVAVGPSEVVVRAQGARGRIAYDSPASREGLARALWLWNELRRERRERPTPVLSVPVASASRR